MNETDVVKHFDEVTDLQWLADSIADEHGDQKRPPTQKQVVAYARAQVKWSELNGWEDGDLASAIIQCARDELSVQKVRDAVEKHVVAHWAELSSKLDALWEE